MTVFSADDSSPMISEYKSISDGDDSLCSLLPSLARGEDVSRREVVRSETVFRSRYDTKIGGSSPNVLVVLDVFIEELETVVGEREVLFLVDEELFKRLLPRASESTKVKNRSAGTLAPSLSRCGLSSNDVYPA
jgi:hypothetical protein